MKLTESAYWCPLIVFEGGPYTEQMKVNLRRHAGLFWVAQLSADADAVFPLLAGLDNNEFWSLTRTADEVSLVSTIENHGSIDATEGPWTLFEVDGVLDFGLVGILSSLTKPMADAAISVFAMSTYNTDFILVKTDLADRAQEVWQESGFGVNRA